METDVTTRKSQVDHRPFRSKAERELEQSLQAHYRAYAVEEVAAVLDQRRRRNAEQAGAEG
jgi:hypothetical protein